jgi:hypothetical protein
MQKAEEDKIGGKITIIAHSIGSMVAYKAVSLNDFPTAKLANIFCLAGPLYKAP